MKFSPPELIAEKRDGREHSPEELRWFLDGFLSSAIPDYQVTAWLMAVYFRGMTFAETVAWTKLIAESGSSIPEAPCVRRVDKHSTGGVGDKTSLLLVPLVTAAAEQTLIRDAAGRRAMGIPMVSGRGLGHSGGTLDKLDSVPGFSSSISLERAAQLLGEQGFCMMGQTDDFAPADRILYALRDVTATVESLPLICSSILGKKIAERLDGLVLDVKAGDGAFMRTQEEARGLARLLLDVAKSCGVETVAVITAMDAPLGDTVGNALELHECAEYLRGGRRHPELHAITLALAAEMLRLGSDGKLSRDEARIACEEALATNRPFEIYRQLFAAQGGRWEEFERCRIAEGAKLKRHDVRAPRSGRFVCRAKPIGRLLIRLGGGRTTKGSSIDPWVGIEMARADGDVVHEGERLLTVLHRGPLTPDMSALLTDAVSIVPTTESGNFGCRVLERME